MYKNILMILGLLVFTACSQNKPEPKIPKPPKVVKTPIKAPIKNEVLTETSTEFIPEHIRRSHIEVVEHY